MIILIFLFSPITDLYGASGSIRSVFHAEELTESRLIEIIESKKFDASALTQAYVGLCETMMAEYAFWPGTKLEYFNNGKEKIEEAIAKKPSQVEIRYVRLLVQLNAPGMLNYDENIGEDLDAFIANYERMDLAAAEIKMYTQNLLEGKNLADEQRNNLQQLLIKLD